MSRGKSGGRGRNNIYCRRKIRRGPASFQAFVYNDKQEVLGGDKDEQDFRRLLPNPVKFGAPV